MDRSLRHGPNRLRSYLTTHETILGQLIYQGVVTVDGITVKEGAIGALYLRGELHLRDGVLRLAVAKMLETVEDGDDPLVQTAWYSYNVSIPGHGNVFRYDCPHEEEDEDEYEHHRHHHRHQFNPFSADPKRYKVSLIKDNDWPVLSEVAHEADLKRPLISDRRSRRTGAVRARPGRSGS